MASKGKKKGAAEGAMFSGLSSNVSVGEAGEKQTDLKIVSGSSDGARRVAALVGRTVVLVAGIEKRTAVVQSVTLQPDAKKQTVIVARAKLGGAADLDKLVGRQITIQKAQRDLPLMRPKA